MPVKSNEKGSSMTCAWEMVFSDFKYALNLSDGSKYYLSLQEPVFNAFKDKVPKVIIAAVDIISQAFR